MMFSQTGATPMQFCNGYAYSANSDSGFDSAGNKHTAPTCAIFAMNTYDVAEALVNMGHLNLLDSHCADEFSMPSSSWERNVSYRWPTDDVPEAYNELGGLGAFNVPPQALVQQYFKCQNKVLTSLSLAFGSSAGTAGIAGTVVVTLLVTIVSAGWFKDRVAEVERAVGAAAAAAAVGEKASETASVVVGVPTAVRDWDGEKVKDKESRKKGGNRERGRTEL